MPIARVFALRKADAKWWPTGRPLSSHSEGEAATEKHAVLDQVALGEKCAWLAGELCRSMQSSSFQAGFQAEVCPRLFG